MDRYRKYQEPVEALQAGEATRQIEHLGRPFNLRMFMKNLGPLERAHFVNHVSPELETHFDANLSSTGELVSKKTGQPMTMGDFKPFAPVIQGIIAAKTDTAERFEDLAAQGSPEMLEDYNKDPLKYLRNQRNQLEGSMGAFQTLGVPTKILERGIERVQGQIDSYTKAEAEAGKALQTHLYKLNEEEYKQAGRVGLAAMKNRHAEDLETLKAQHQQDLIPLKAAGREETEEFKHKKAVELQELKNRHALELEEAKATAKAGSPSQVLKKMEKFTRAINMNFKRYSKGGPALIAIPSGSADPNAWLQAAMGGQKKSAYQILRDEAKTDKNAARIFRNIEDWYAKIDELVGVPEEPPGITEAPRTYDWRDYQ
jgi:hypothetical protein